MTTPLKIVAVGDSGVGKTCLLKAFATPGSFPVKYKQTVFDIYSGNITVDRLNYNLSLYDTAGHKNFEALNPIRFPDTDCFLLCYSTNDRESFRNIRNKWWPQISRFLDIASSVILVCTKLDLAKTRYSENYVTETSGMLLQNEIGASVLIGCSAFENSNIIKIFEDAVRLICLTRDKARRRSDSISLTLFNKLYTTGSETNTNAEDNVEENIDIPFNKQI